jgi:hypothetical protein
MKNIPASVRQRLAELAKQRQVAFARLLIQYGAERLLYRLSQSKHAENFVLKGAMLFVIWEGAQHRETRDISLLGFGGNSVENLIRVFSEVCAVRVPDDGLVFGDITAAPIVAVQEYGGVTVKIQAKLGQARIVIHIDVGFGDRVTPRPKLMDFPTLLDFPAPRVRTYPVETVVTEKLQALVALGPKNSRMKDFFDLDYLARAFEFDGKVLCQAIRGTFERRKTLIPQTIPLGLTREFAVEKKTYGQLFCLVPNRSANLSLSPSSKDSKSSSFHPFKLCPQAKRSKSVGRRAGRGLKRRQERFYQHQSKPQKVALAMRLRRETALTIEHLASRLRLGTPKSASTRLREWHTAHPSPTHPVYQRSKSTAAS